SSWTGCPVPAGPGWSASTRMRLEATKYVRRSCATSTTGRTTRLLRSRSTEASGGIHQKHLRCHRSTLSPQSSAAGTAPVGRGTSVAAAASEKHSAAAHSAPTAIYGFFFAASFALFAAPAPSTRARTHRHAHTHAHTVLQRRTLARPLRPSPR
ncbi:hypothetical protein V5799_009841, partial [Amblyomma americanum]